MHSEAFTLDVKTCTEAGRSRPNLPSIGGPWPSGTRRVFWAVEQAEEAAEAVEPQQPAASAGSIEITLADGIRVRVDNQVDGTALRRVIEALQGRQIGE